jgi:hypothetical protein
MNHSADFLPALRNVRAVMRAANSLGHLPLSHWAVLLEILGQHNDTIRHCVARTGYERTTVKTAIETLEARGYLSITRFPSPTGGHRRISATLTAAGATVLQALAAATLNHKLPA